MSKLYKAGYRRISDTNFQAVVMDDGRENTLTTADGRRVRSFRTQAAAMAAADKEIKARIAREADALKRRPLPVPHVAARLLSGVTMPRNPSTIWRQPRG